MGLLSGLGLTRKKTEEKQEQPQAAEPSTSAPATPAAQELVHDTPSRPQALGGLSIPEHLRMEPSLLTSAPALNLPNSPQGRLYDPYEGVASAVGGKRHAFKLNDDLEFVFEEEAAVRRRGWTENLQFYTGMGYVAGGTAGVGAGFYKYLTTKPEVATETLRLKANRLLNSSGQFARPFGNGFGILGLYFASLESLLFLQLDYYHVPQSVNSVIAGAVSGALFRAPRGPRQAAVAGAIGAVGGAGIAALRRVFPSL